MGTSGEKDCKNNGEFQAKACRKKTTSFGRWVQTALSWIIVILLISQRSFVPAKIGRRMTLSSEIFPTGRFLRCDSWRQEREIAHGFFAQMATKTRLLFRWEGCHISVVSTRGTFSRISSCTCFFYLCSSKIKKGISHLNSPDSRIRPEASNEALALECLIKIRHMSVYCQFSHHRTKTPILFSSPASSLGSNSLHDPIVFSRSARVKHWWGIRDRYSCCLAFKDNGSP